MLQDRTNHNRFADQLAQRIARSIPAASGPVTAAHNQPPGPIEQGREAFAELSVFLRETPVIANQAEAKQGSGFIERTRIAIAEMEAERTAKVKPLNDEVSKINAAYRTVRDPLETALKTLRARLTRYASDVEAARIAEANRLRAEAEERERIAREAEAREQAALADADEGECTDVGGAIAEADQAFDSFARANRAAARAAREVPVRFGSVVGGRAQTMHTVEVLVVDDACKAIKVLGMTDKIRDAILSSARDFRKQFDELPEGVVATFERSL